MYVLIWRSSVLSRFRGPRVQFRVQWVRIQSVHQRGNVSRPRRRVPMHLSGGLRWITLRDSGTIHFHCLFYIYSGRASNVRFNQGHSNEIRFTLFARKQWQMALIFISFPLSPSVRMPNWICTGEPVRAEPLRTQSKVHRSRNQYQLRMHSRTRSSPLRWDELGKRISSSLDSSVSFRWLWSIANRRIKNIKCGRIFFVRP